MDAKAAARETVDSHERSLLGLSHRSHAHPELRFEEEQSSAWTAGVLADAGLTVETGTGDMPTAFTCRFGDGPLHLAICAEYDSLPAIGHACGHNVIAAMAVGAAIAAARVADDVGLRLSVFGTPAEEVCDAGGKILLLERGAFEAVRAAMRALPGPVGVVEHRITASTMFAVHYTGKEAHAPASPSWASTRPMP